MTGPVAVAGRQALAPAGRLVVGVSAVLADRRESEHLLGLLVDRLPQGLVGCTHLVTAPWRHEALSLEVPCTDPGALLPVLRECAPDAGLVVLDELGDVLEVEAEGLAGAREAAQAHATRTAGRAVVFPGQDLLVGEVPVAEVVERTAVEAVQSLHGDYADDAVLVTGGFVRPVFRDGRLVVLVGHADPRRLLPWELPNPTPCCADH